MNSSTEKDSESTTDPGAFPDIRFTGTLRPSQADVVKIAKAQFELGQRRLHIVAPPGSGKTVLGLYLWAECVRRPALVLSPNSAIQAQWGARTDLFHIPPEANQNGQQAVRLDGEKPALLTSLTYQSVTMPSSASEDDETAALRLWRVSLVDQEHAQDTIEAQVWIEDLQLHNQEYFQSRLSLYRKKVREEISLAGETLSLLHPNSLLTIERMREANVGLLILDECHHLMGHWGRVLAEVQNMLDDPVIIGLTATPPDRAGKKTQDLERYDAFFGPIDYEVPVPAVVKDGFLAPYQDLAYFVRPTTEELAFVANTDDDLNELIELLCLPPYQQELESENRAVQEQTPDDKLIDEPDEIIDESESGESADIEQLSETDDVVQSLASQDLGADQVEDVDTEADDIIAADELTDAMKEAAAEELPHRCAESLPQWLGRVLSERRLSTGIAKTWSTFYRRDPVFADAARIFLKHRQIELPENVPSALGIQEKGKGRSADSEKLEMEVLVPVIDRYVRHRLRRSKDRNDHQLARQVIRRMRVMGVQITETGARACASPVGRVLAYSHAKNEALTTILTAEINERKEGIRAIVVTDFEKSSAVSAEVSHLLSDESGGAVAAFKTLVNHPETDWLNPILVTGSSVLVDGDVIDQFNAVSQKWLAEKGFNVELSDQSVGSFHMINGKGSDWCPRVYVEMITELFQDGLTRCLVGTRGLLGEGWDANKINVLVDLTTVTTSMSVNQLRGRSIRLDPKDALKLANNWDVVCIAPEFTKGLDDYKRFEAKHHTLYGVTDDGAIEKGVGHVHAAFTELKPEGIEQSTQILNEDMLDRVGKRDWFRSLWKIGQPYRSEPVRAVEAKIDLGVKMDFPPFSTAKDPWSAESLAAAIGRTVLYALDEVLLIKRRHTVQIGQRAGDYVRLFLDGANPEENAIFGTALREALGPIGKPRYVIPRNVERRKDNWLSRISPEITRRFFQEKETVRVMLHAVPTVLSKNKDLAGVYQRYWNRYVSPGEVIYTMNATGEDALEAAKRSEQIPDYHVREKEIFI